MNLQGNKIYLMGICGTAMASFAGLLKKQGYDVVGSDKNVYPPMSELLKDLNIPVLDGYVADHLDQEKPDLVIVGNVISRTNPEAQRLEELGLPYMSFPQAMSKFLLSETKNIVVSGTHGKTTTTSLMSWVAKQEGLEPGFLVGGIPKNYGVSFSLGAKEWFVIEGDEYDTAYFDKVPKFIHYNPHCVILTSVEFDHADIYDNLDQIKQAFSRLMKLIPEEGLLVYNGDDPVVTELAKLCASKKVSYGESPKADVRVSRIQPQRDGLSFDLDSEGQKQELFLPMFGRYNALNAAAVWAVQKHLGWSGSVEESFKSFQGVKRRQEIIGQPNDILVIEDFAHHPTAVAETLKTFSQREGGGRLHAVFEPRSATSRRDVFQKAYAEAFTAADAVYLAQPYLQKSIPKEEWFSSDRLVQDIKSKNSNISAGTYESVDQIVDEIRQNAKPGDTVVIMSNGAFDDIYGKILQALA